MSGIRLVVLDMAGTTISDEGVVMEAFHRALADAGIRPQTAPFADAERIVRDTMGQSKIEVFRQVLGGEEAAQRANVAFEQACDDLVRAGRVCPIPGAEEVLAELRSRGIRTCLTTGFSPPTREALLKKLGWELAADLALSPADAGRGRPHPDLLWTAMLRLRAPGVDAVAAVGDTASDMVAATRAGAVLRCGVLTGADGSERLRQSGATHILASVSDLPALL